MVSVMNGIWMDGENNEYEYNMIDDSSVPRVDWFTLLLNNVFPTSYLYRIVPKIFCSFGVVVFSYYFSPREMSRLTEPMFC